MSTLPLPRSRLALYLDLIRWDRPAGWLLLLWPTLSALWIAADGWPGWHLVAVFVLGTILMRSAGCCVNDVADKEFDRHVKRTARRPVTSGLVSVREALTVGALLALAAFGLVLTTAPPAILLSFSALVVTLAYPYAKRGFGMPQAVLGVAFSFGLPGGDDGGVVVGGAEERHLLLHTVDDDLQIGIKTSAITLGRWDVAAVMGFYAIYLASWAALGLSLGLGRPYLIGIAAAAAQAGWHYTLIKDRTREGCFKAFRLNHWVGFAVFCGVAADLALR